MSKDEIKEILMLTDEGIEEIISYRSEAYKDLDIDFDELRMSDLLDLFIEEPSLIRAQLLWTIVDYKLDSMMKKFECFYREKFAMLDY